ncbi:hypothetical protein [Salipiger sp. PrR003]|uniref:hypothetical protein n=1 Tax=Salipiger sp. PrR003 TaxID=2706776 RepID=UPI0013DBF044|nr:hypothetical protein [Salipiger sp. PrR003]NDV50192.1 hypothetical protein [Salipiger sp. PrR003]
MPQTGPFVHDENDKFFLKFPSEGDTPRVFTVVKASAYNAGGLIASEKNGIAILDNGSQESPGTSIVACDVLKGRHADATRTFETLRERSAAGTVTWDEFKGLVRDLKQYRQNVYEIDMNMDEPFEGNRLNLIALGALEPGDEPDIRTPEMIEAHEGETDYTFPAAGRSAMIAEIMNHDVHRDGRYGSFYLSWNAKMGMSLDETGKLGEDVSSEFDEAWSEYYEENQDTIFSDITSDMASYYTEGLYTTYPGDDQGDYSFSMQGRSGGHLVLTVVDGEKVAFEGYSDVGVTLENFTDSELAQLYKVVRSLDVDVTEDKLQKEWAYQLNLHRQQREEEWVNEMSPAM